MKGIELNAGFLFHIQGSKSHQESIIYNLFCLPPLHACTCVCMHRCTYLCILKAKVNHGMSFHRSHLAFFQSLTSIDLCKQMRLSEQQAQGGPVFHFPRQRATRVHHNNYFFRVGARDQAQVSLVVQKATSPANSVFSCDLN